MLWFRDRWKCRVASWLVGMLQKKGEQGILAKELLKWRVLLQWLLLQPNDEVHVRLLLDVDYLHCWCSQLVHVWCTISGHHLGTVFNGIDIWEKTLLLASLYLCRSLSKILQRRLLSGFIAFCVSVGVIYVHFNPLTAISVHTHGPGNSRSSQCYFKLLNNLYSIYYSYIEITKYSNLTLSSHCC